MDITQATERQFKRILEKQGKTVYDVKNDCERKVMFLRQSAKNGQEKIRIGYPQDYPWSKGTVIKYHDMYFIITSREAFESDVYHVSVAIKCNRVWQLNGKEYYIVAGDLGSPNPKNGTISSTVGGTLSLYTNDDGSKMLSINDDVYDFRGTYTCINLFTIDGLAYYYFERDTDNTSKDFILTWNTTDTVFNIDEIQSVTLNCTLMYTTTGSGTTYDPSAEYHYYVSDEDIATIDDKGNLTFHKTGNVQVMCTAHGGYLYPNCENDFIATKEISIVSNETSYATITGVDQYGKDIDSQMPLYYRGYTLTAHYFVGNEEDTSKVPVSWTAKDCEGTPITMEEGTMSHWVDLGGGYESEGSATYVIEGNTITVTPSTTKSQCEIWYYAEPTFIATYEDGVTVERTVSPRWT